MPDTITPPPELRGAKVRLTPLQIENIHRHFEWNNDPELNRMDTEVPYVEERFGAFKQRFESMLRPSFTNVDLEIHAIDGPLIGVVHIADINRHNQHCLIGLTIGDRNYWGKGYGRDALALVLQYCFQTLDMHRVSAEPFEYNTAWQRLVEGMGFTHEGTERDYLHRNERYWDKHIYGLLRPTYEAMDLPELSDTSSAATT